jgi:signal transduction histidine kinase
MPNSDILTTSSLLHDIEKYFGFVPHLFANVQDNIELLAALWHQTRITYIDNPLPSVVKEKIFIYLSYTSNIPYDLRYHCIRLNISGVEADDIVTLLQTPLSTEQEIVQHIEHMKSIPEALNAWPQQDIPLEIALFACIAHLFMQRQQALHCRQELQRLLGKNYASLTSLFTYIHTCHDWIKADPEVFRESNEAILNHFKQVFGTGTALEDLLNIAHQGICQTIEQTTSAKEARTAQKTVSQTHPIVWHELNQHMSDFLGVTAHEFKTPITTIKATIQILQRAARREMQRTNITIEEHKQAIENIQQILTRADDQIRRLTRLINDMVLISRIQDQKLDLRLEYQNLSALVQEIVNQQRQLNPHRSIRLDNQLKTLPVWIDRDHIEQVITNYLSNALKYSQGNQPVDIDIQRQGKKICVTVHDDGPGITTEDQEHIWERFYRAKQTEVQSGSSIGFGLGLYISRSIIERHGGEVGVQSQPGQGSVFWFTLQLAEQS